MYTQWEREAIAEVEGEILAQNPIISRFQAVNFVSKSKAKGRKRKYETEVTLVHDSWERGNCWHTAHNFPWDCKATEAGVSEGQLIETLVGRYEAKIR